MGKKFFTVDEVNELIPQLEHHFQQLVLHKREMSKAALRLRKLGVEPQLLDGPLAHPNAESEALHRQLMEHYLAFKQQLLSIEGMGGEIKDLELGRVDFPSLEQGREGHLTWQLGVTENAYRQPGAEVAPAVGSDKPKILKVS